MTKSTTTRPGISEESGFSLMELMFALVITLVITGLAFSLLAGTLRQKTRQTAEAASLADANQSISWMGTEIMNAGFGLKTNGLVAADCGEATIRVRANLNAFLKETTSGTVTDANEDVIYRLVADPDGGSAVVRSDVGAGQSTIIASKVDDIDVDNDGDGDGLTFTYLDAAGAAVTPANAVRVTIDVRIILPQIGTPGSPGFQPSQTRLVSKSVVLRNSRLAMY